MIDVRTTNTTAAKSSTRADKAPRFGKRLIHLVLEQEQLIKEKQAAVAEWQKTLDDLTLAKDTRNKSDTKEWNRKLKKATEKRDAQHNKLVELYSKKKYVAKTESEITRADKVLQHLKEKGTMRDSLLTCHFASTATADIDEAEAMLERSKEEKDKPTKAIISAKDMVNKLEGELVKLKDDLIKLEKARKKKGIQPMQIQEESRDDEQDTSVLSVEIDEAMPTFEQSQKLVSKLEKIIEKKTNSLHKWQKTLDDLTQARAAKNKSAKKWGQKLKMYTAERDAKIKVYTEACLKTKAMAMSVHGQVSMNEINRAEKTLKHLKQKGDEPTKSMKKAEKNLKRLKEEKDKLSQKMKHAQETINTLKDELVELNDNKYKLKKGIQPVPQSKERKELGNKTQSVTNKFQQAESRDDEQDTSVLSVEIDEPMSPFEQLQQLVSKQEKIIEKKTNSLHKWQTTLAGLTQARAAKNKSAKKWDQKLKMYTAERDAKIKVYTETCLNSLGEEKRAEKTLKHLKQKGDEPTKSMKKAEFNLKRLKREIYKLKKEMKHAQETINTLKDELVKLKDDLSKLEQALLNLPRPGLGFLGDYLIETIGCFMCGDDSLPAETDDDFTRFTNYTEDTDY